MFRDESGASHTYSPAANDPIAGSTTAAVWVLLLKWAAQSGEDDRGIAGGRAVGDDDGARRRWLGAH